MNIGLNLVFVPYDLRVLQFAGQYTNKECTEAYVTMT